MINRRGRKGRSAAEPQPKAKPFNAEERSKQRKDEESQKINHGGTEARRHRENLIYKPINKSLFEEGQKQKLATKDTEAKQRSQRKIWEKEVTKIRRKPQRILGIVVQRKNQNLTTNPRPAQQANISIEQMSMKNLREKEDIQGQ